MRKCFLIISLFALLLPGIAIPQNPGTSCGQKEVTDRLFINNPHLKTFQKQIEKQFQVHALKVKQGLEQPYQPNAVVTLPVVVHIIHNNGTENISNAQVFTAIQHLNEAFANTGYYDPADGVNTEIQFCLAQRDPNNNPTNGIDRVVSPLTVMDGWNNGAQDIAVKNLSRWDPRCYINIWIVKDIIGPVAGYAYLPSAHGMNIDGIVGEAAYFGSSNANDVLIIHEMGHYLGLYHTFQGGCTNNDCTKDGDQVCDTPPDQSTAGISCNSTANSCSTDALSGFSSDVNDLHTDYLDYGNWNCMKVFTQGQATRMNWMIQNVRKSLLDCKSCMSPCPAPVIANFSSSGNNVSVGTTVNFTNSSANASGYKWYVNNTLQTNTTNFSYTFNSVGTYIIKLSALTNNLLCDTAVKFDTVRVSCSTVANFSPGDTSLPTGQNINFINTSSGATTYQWFINGVLQSTAVNFVFGFSLPGQHTIKLVSGNGFCSSSKESTVFVSDTCQRQNFLTRITNPNMSFLYQTQILALSDGGVLLTGQGPFSLTNTLAGVLTKIDGSGNILWTRYLKADITAQEGFFKTIRTRDGGYMVLGNALWSSSPTPYNGYLLIKMDVGFNIQWTKTVFDNRGFDFLDADIIETASGYAISATSDGPSIDQSIWLCQLDGTGNILWSKNYKSTVVNENYASLTMVTMDNNIYVSGTRQDSLAILIKADLNTGIPIWIKEYTRADFGTYHKLRTLHTENGRLIALGRNNRGSPHYSKIVIDTDGNIQSSQEISPVDLFKTAITAMEKTSDGYIISFRNGQATGTDLGMAKLNNNLDTLWTKSYRVASFNTALTAVTELADRSFATSGYYSNPETVLLKTDQNGNIGTSCNPSPGIFAKNNIQFNTANRTVITTDLTVFSPTNGIIVDTLVTLTSTPICEGSTCVDPPDPPVDDSCKRSTFQKTYESDHSLEIRSIEPAADGGSILAGIVRRTNRVQNDALAIKLSPNGSVQWSQALVGAGQFFSELYKIRQTRDGGYIAIGRHITFDFETYFLVVRLASNGTIIWAKKFISEGNGDDGTDVIELSNGSFAITGTNGVTPAVTFGIIFVLDNAGTYLWGKSFYANDGSKFHSCVEVGDTLTIAGDNLVKATNSYIGTVVKINKNNGALYSSAGFVMDGKGNYGSKIFKTNYGYFLATFIMNFQDWPGKSLGMLRLDNDFNILTGHRLAVFDYSQWAYASPATDTTIIATAFSTIASIMYNVNPTSPAVNKWERSYGTSLYGHEPVNPISLPNGYLMTASTYITNTNTFRKAIFIAKTDNAGNTGACPTGSPGGFAISASVTRQQFSWSNIIDYIPLENNTVDLFPEPISLTQNTFCSSCDSITPPPDTCGNITFQKKIGTPGADAANDIKVLPGNEYLVAGFTNLRPTNEIYTSEALLLRLNSKGKIVWQKMFKGARGDAFSKIVLDNNNEFFVFGSSYSNNNPLGSMLLTKFQGDGNLLWSKEFSFVNSSITGFVDVGGAIRLLNGDLAFCANAAGINTDVGQPLQTTYNIIGVISPTGALRWVKRLREYYIESGGSVKGIIEMGGALFIAADYGIIKMNEADGSLMGLQKKFQNLGSLSSIEVLGSQIMAYSGTHQLLFDQSLNLISAYSIVTGETGYTMNTEGFSSQKGSDIQGYYGRSNVERSNFLLRSSGAGILDWAFRYPYSLKEWRHVLGSQRTNDNGTVSIGWIRPDLDVPRNEPSDIYILRTDSGGRINDCPRSSVNITLQPVQGIYIELHARNYPITTNIYNLNIQMENPALSETSICNTANCNVLNLQATDTVCRFTDVFQVKAIRDTSCDAFTEWIVDTTVARIISQNDTLLNLQFKKSGVFTIYARLTGGCRLLQDSVTVTVFNSPDSVNLGPDIQLCKISTYTFKAGAGFKSYKWQDGSSDSTLTIYNPGVYHVTAEDYCGNLYSDTVVVSQSPDIPFDLGPDLKKCNNDTLTITAPVGFNKYYWSPGYRVDSLYSRIIKVSPEKDTTYIVIAEKAPGCLVIDSIRVTVNHSIPLHLGNDTSFCQNDSITINATAGFTNYQWNTGANTPSIRVRVAGQYNVSATDSNGCISRDSLEILPLFTLPVVNIGTDFSLCRNTVHEFDAGNFNTYLWQDGSINRRFTTSQTGTYWVRVSNANGCVNQDTATIISYLENPKDFLDSSADICLGQLLEVKAKTGYNRYRWFNNSSSSTINITAPGIYWVEVTNAEGCTARDSISVKAKDCLKGVFFPNAFTPSNGGKNNFFRPVVYGQLESFYLIVYNRYGQKVFETRDAYKGWDGKINGLLQGTNTFAWSAIYKFSGTNEKQQSAKGTVTLIR